MMWLWFLFAPLTEQQTLLRVTYDIIIVGPEDRLIASMSLNKLNDDRFIISCRKDPGGTLFTYWATSEENYLWFPKSGVAFEGAAAEQFGLFPGGPMLSRAQWISMLNEQPPQQLGDWFITHQGDWWTLTDQKQSFTVYWREKKRSVKDNWRERMFTPRRKPGADIKPLAQFSEYWR